MNTWTADLRSLNWPLILGLGVLALVRPLARIIEDQADADLSPLLPIALTVAITVLWIAVVAFTRVSRPVLTLVCTGLTYGVLTIPLSAIISALLNDRLEGPLAMPIAIVPLLIVNAIWGAVAGAVALAIQRARN
ncbi:hypothetical protein ACWDYH_17890 [Nocardia goodfellowii]